MNNLHTLLEDASSDVPVEAFELDAIVSSGRSRVRRRRAVGGLALAAVVGLGAALVVPGGSGDGDHQPTSPPQVRVLTLDDASQAEPGRDYQVLREFTAHQTDAAMTGVFVRAVLPDGTIVAQRHEPAQVVLIAGPEARGVEMPPTLGNYLGATDRELVFGSDRDTLWMLDRASLQWREVGRLLDVNQDIQPLTGQDGRVFVAGSAFAEESSRPILSIDTATGQATEVARGGNVAAAAGRVAWTDVYDAPTRTVTVRDEQGALTTFDPHTGECVTKGLGMTAQRIVLMSNCQDEAGDSERTDIVTRVDVFDLDGDPLTRIESDDYFGPVRMSDRYLTLPMWEGERGGTYTYDLETERFLHVEDTLSSLVGRETGSGSTLVWEKRLDGGSGATYVVAQMR